MGGIAPGLPAGANIIDKPLRFTDSPQHYASSSNTAGSNAPTPSPRRKSSSTSEEIYSPETARLERIERVPTIYMGNVTPSYPDYGPPAYTIVPQDYYRPAESAYFMTSDYQYVNYYLYIYNKLHKKI